MFADDQLLPISALQHLLFCERQCALIHVEQLWAENRLTVEGRQLHHKAHDPKAAGARPRQGVRVTRGMKLACYQHGLFGVADIVEFHQPNAAPGEAAAHADGDHARDLILPIEYKRGKPKKHDADKVQLCAQALCLEEMLGATVPAGAIFYGQTRRRQEVPFTTALRDGTIAAAQRLHDMIARGKTPTARRQPKCEKCSMLHLCLPDALRPRRTAAVYLQQMTQSALADA